MSGKGEMPFLLFLFPLPANSKRFRKFLNLFYETTGTQLAEQPEVFNESKYEQDDKGKPQQPQQPIAN
jgi:hypothetical protein